MRLNHPAHRPWLDSLRTWAALSVVWLHVSGAAFIDPARFGSAEWWGVNLLHTLVNWGVDVFVMISGALLLAPGREETPGVFYRRRAGRLLWPFAFWTAVYLTLRLRRDPQYGFASAAADLFSHGPYYHLWYFYVLFGLYLATPFLRLLLRAASASELRLLIGLILGINAAAVIGSLVPMPGFEFFGQLSWSVGFLGYYLLGHYLANISPGNWRPSLLIAGVALGVAVTALGTYLLIRFTGVENGLRFCGNHAPGTALLAAGVFMLARRTPEKALSRWVGRAAPLTLGIYVIHPLFILGWPRTGSSIYPWGPLLSIPIVGLIIATGAGAISYLMLRLPGLRRVI